MLRTIKHKLLSLRGAKQLHKKVTHPTMRLLRSYLTRNDLTLVFRHSESSEGISKRKNISQTATSVRVFYSKHENKMYRELQKRTNKHISSSDPIPTQSEPAVNSIYKQNPLKMAEALEAIIVMLNLI